MRTKVRKKIVVKPKIFIATPMYGGMSTGHYTASMMKLIREFIALGWEYEFLFRFNESLIDRARNALTANFMTTDGTHLLFIDADIGFEPEDIIKMVQADKDIICGIYPSKTINWASVGAAARSGVPDKELAQHTGSWVVNFVNYGGDQTVRIDEPFEVWNAGTGMMLIKRHVFEILEKRVEKYRLNEFDDVMLKFEKTGITRYFATSIDPISGVLLSEDYHFCRIWREEGGKVWAAPWVRLSHVGTYTFSGRPREEKS